MTTSVQSRDEAQIRELVAEQQVAMRERDPERIVARYAPDVVKFDLAPPLQYVGPQARDVEGLRGWFSGFDGPVDIEIRDLTVSIGGDVAFCHSLHRMSATPHGAGEGFSMWFRVTAGLRKIDGRWLITHEHASTPFYMDGSFKACTDLEP